MNARVNPAETGRAALYPHILGLVTPLLVEPVIRAPYLSIAHWLRDFRSWPLERRQAWQHDRLQAVIAHARVEVPFYRLTLGMGPAGAVLLSELPVVDKATIRSSGASFLSEGWERMRYITKRTGGTTGDPWRYPLDLRAWAHMYGAALHLWERTGYLYGERMALLGTPPSLVPGGTGLRRRLRANLERRNISAAGIEIDRTASLRRAQLAGEAGAALWYGFASTIGAMAEAVVAEHMEVAVPRAIVTTGESLQPQVRIRIESAFRVPLFDQYGCNDGGVLAQSCHRGRYHLAENVSIVEILEGDQPCPPGVEGDVAVTNLHSRVLPFLRYKVGDRAVLGEGICPCGEPGPTLARLAGRELDVLKLPDGTELTGLPLMNAFKQAPNVLRWQIVQPHSNVLRVRLEVGPDFGEEEGSRITEFLKKHCRGQATVVLTTTEPIERTAGGKHKVVIRLFD